MSKNTYSGVILTFAACAVLAGVVGASTVGTQNSNSSTKADDAQNSNTAGAGNANAGAHAGHSTGGMTRDARFAAFAAMGGMAEVELGRLAAQKGASEDVRQFGQRMVDDHTKANEELMRIVSGKGLALPTALDAKHQSMAQKMSALSGEKFDREYAKMMVSDHKKAIAEFQKEAQRGADPELKAFAAAKLPALQEHLRMAQRLNDKVSTRGGSDPNAGSPTNANGNSNSNR